MTMRLTLRRRRCSSRKNQAPLTTKIVRKSKLAWHQTSKNKPFWTLSVRKKVAPPSQAKSKEPIKMIGALLLILKLLKKLPSVPALNKFLLLQISIQIRRNNDSINSTSCLYSAPSRRKLRGSKDTAHLTETVAWIALKDKVWSNPLSRTANFRDGSKDQLDSHVCWPSRLLRRINGAEILLQSTQHAVSFSFWSLSMVGPYFFV
jgi:hypothetical protein